MLFARDNTRARVRKIAALGCQGKVRLPEQPYSQQISSICSIVGILRRLFDRSHWLWPVFPAGRKFRRGVGDNKLRVPLLI